MLISNKGNTALHIAASKGHIKIVELLLKHMKENNASKLNYFINAKTSVGGTTAMHIAINLEIYGAIFDIKNKKGQTPLDLSKDQSITNLLTLTDELFKASENNGEVIVQKLSKLSNNEIVAIVNARNVKGNTLLENTIFYQPPDIARNLRSFLLEQKIIL
ncbi:ANK_REP_REGION domain-containing protein [Nephila pilipes]|uniref:ANK_REP_REGION domain-containing protein n=1 Tax=Nephila pilipes TaxID=299642 RepID=A0A8X6JS28_NEPPI|nr:ANK_REP_REGION domain-containing protein [Nephila pilipes]